MGGGSPQGSGLWSFRGDDDGGGDGSGVDSGGGGGGGGADGQAKRGPEQQHAVPQEWRRRAQSGAPRFRSKTKAGPLEP
jgi:hypothetical protein